MRKIMIKYASILAIAILLIVAMMTVFFRKSINEETLESHSFYQYLSGIKFEYTGNLKIQSDNNITELTFDEVTVMLDSTPLYYKDEKKVLLPKTMSITYPLSNSTQYKINYFSRIYIDNNAVYLIEGKDKKSLQNCFLYDGKDLYFFIEETTIKIKDQEIIIPPLSYVVLTYNDNIQIYDYNLDELKTISINNEEIKATAKGYTINLSIDAVMYNENSRLLIKNINYLKNI